MCWSQNSYVLRKQLSMHLCCCPLAWWGFFCLFFPLSSQASILNLMLLVLCAWRNNRIWKIEERVKCKKINLRRTLTMKKVLIRGWKLVWIYLTKMYGALRYCASELKQWQGTERLPYCPANAMACPFIILSLIPLFASMEQGSSSSISFCYWFHWENIRW